MKGQNLDDSNPVDDFFPKQKLFGGEKQYKEDFIDN